MARNAFSEVFGGIPIACGYLVGTVSVTTITKPQRLSPICERTVYPQEPMLQLSPALERAESLATSEATTHGREFPDLCDWLTGLLADDDGRARQTLAANVPDSEHFLLSLHTLETRGPTIPAERLYREAVQHSVRLRGDPALTTDLVFYAACLTDTTMSRTLESLGLNLRELESFLRSPDIVPQGQLTTKPFMVDEPTDVQQSLGFVDNSATTFADFQSRSSEPRFSVETVSGTDAHDLLRILDVNYNRATESLRVLDDYARLSRNDRILTETCKGLRHELVQLREAHGFTNLTRARDTQGDIGTTISGANEYHRPTLSDVAKVNLKRLHEALRSLEEFGKVRNVAFAKAIEQLRYRAYTLEKAFFTRDSLRERLFESKIYALLSSSQCVAALDWTIAELAAGGVGIVQLREKNLTDRELLAKAHNVRRWTQKAGILFIMNDRPDIARLVEADGVHVGQDDLSLRDARRILGPDAIIGVSTHNLEQVKTAVFDGADYLGYGPTFPSTTKQFEQFAGLDFLREAATATSLPGFALGGISLENVGQVMATGISRVAVSAVLATSDDPQQTARRLWGLLHSESN